MMNSKLKVALFALFVLFFLLFNAPFLTVPSGMMAGVPTIMLYIGSFWIILIVMMRMIFSQENKENK